MFFPQGEANTLLGMAKRFRTAASVNVAPGLAFNRDLDSLDGTEAFLLDVRTNQFRLSKFMYQNRARRILILARLCTDKPHTNPDGQAVGPTHLHRYVEGYEDRFADPIDPAMFTDLASRPVTLEEFCKYCNIVVPQIVEAGTLGGP